MALSQSFTLPEGVSIYGLVTDAFTWLWLQLWSLAGPIVSFLFAGLLVWYVYDSGWRTPLESKVIKDCHLHKNTLHITEHDDGYFLFKEGKEEGPEGFVHTKPEGKHKMIWTGFFARPSLNDKEMQYPENASEEQKEEVDQTNKLAKLLGVMATERRYLRGAKVPCTVGYDGKAILSSVKAIAALQFLEALDRIGELPANLSAVKEIFGFNWNSSQIAMALKRREQIGAEKQKRFGQHGDLIMLLISAGIFFGGLAALALVISAFF
jgi:hypothetical protein